MLPHSMLRIALFLGLVGVSMLATASAANVIPQGASAVNVNGEDREGKAGKTFGLLPSIISLITFDNDPCTGASGATGVCYSQKECKNMGGTMDGTCANGYGVCCMTNAVCDGTITTSGTYFNSPRSPYNTAGICTVTLDPPEGTCQIKIELEKFDLLGPIEGDCTNDTFVVTGNNPGTEIPVICGENGGQHMYIDIDNSDGPYQLMVTTSDEDYNRDWMIKVTYLMAGDDCAPNRCLQYHTETTGDIESFAFPTVLNNQKYAICFGYVKGYCDVGLDFTRFDLGNINGVCAMDWLAAGTEKLCGDFATLTTKANSTAGPVVLTVMTDDDGSNVEEGFSGSYTMMGC